MIFAFFITVKRSHSYLDYMSPNDYEHALRERKSGLATV